MPDSDLVSRRCKPCSGADAPLEAPAAETLAASVGWELSPDAKAIRRVYTMKDFSAAVEFVNRIAGIAQQEDHHPDLHLTGYRNLRIELSTHAIGGLSENDFILAAKINDLPKRLKS